MSDPDAMSGERQKPNGEIESYAALKVRVDRIIAMLEGSERWGGLIHEVREMRGALAEVLRMQLEQQKTLNMIEKRTRTLPSGVT